MQELNIGVITDSHSGRFDFQIVEALKKHNLDAAVYLGDAPSNIRDHPRKHFKEIARSVLTFDKIGVPVYWMPGNYEDFKAYTAAFKELDDDLNYVWDTSGQNGSKSLVQYEDYSFVFIPGSSAYTRGFHVRDDKETGNYESNQGPIHIFNLNDLKTRVENPEKTVVFAHHPCYIEGERTIDLAIHAMYRGRKIVGPEAHQLVKMKRASSLISHEGDEKLTQLFRELGIKKFCSGDIHEGVAINDLDGRMIEEGEFSDELFANPGPAKEGDYGILTLRNDGKAAMRRYNITGEKRDYFNELMSPIILLK